MKLYHKEDIIKKFTYSPLQKYEEFNRFPKKLLIHIFLVLITTGIVYVYVNISKRSQARNLVRSLLLQGEFSYIKEKARQKHNLDIWFSALNKRETLEYLMAPVPVGSMENAMNNVAIIRGLCNYPQMRNYLVEFP